MNTPRRHASLAGLVACLTSIVLPGAVLAATWQVPITVWDRATAPSGTIRYPTSLVAVDDQRLVLSYIENTPDAAITAYVSRSSDGGLTWSAGKRVSRVGSATRQSYTPVLASYGSIVDVAWDEVSDGSAGRIRYARSVDGGVTFQQTIALSDTRCITVARCSVSYPQIAHGPNGVVMVAWYNYTKQKVIVRISRDDGITFARRQALLSVPPVWRLSFTVAAGDGAMYVAADAPGSPVMLRRSSDGNSWTSPAQLSGPATTNSSGPFDNFTGVKVVAQGDQAYLGFIRHTLAGDIPVIRHTTDAGASWSKAVGLGPAGQNVDWPYISIDGATARVAYSRCVTTTNPCASQIFYRRTGDGVSWSPAQELAPEPAGSTYPFGLARATDVVVGYSWRGNIDVIRAED